MIHEFTGKRVLVVGDVVLDEYVHGSVNRLNPESTAPLLQAEKENAMTGGAGNVAKNLAQLGAQATLISVIGEDTTSEKIAFHAQKEGYTAHFLSDLSRPTIRKIRFYKGIEQLLRVDYEKVHDISAAVEDQVIATIDATITQGVDAVIISDYAKGVVTRRVAEHLLKVSTKKHLLAADVKPSRAPFITGAHLISPNLKEARQFLGLAEDDTTDSLVLAQKLHAKIGGEVYITLGADGIAYYVSETDKGRVPQEHVVEVFDVSGAGDTVIAVLVLARLGGATALEAAQLGNAAGAVVVTKVGSVGLSVIELSDMIFHHHNHDKT